MLLLLSIPRTRNLASEIFLSSSFVVICYHAATRTGQTSPISPHFTVSLLCCLLWG
jgi:hypothetical protein